MSIKVKMPALLCILVAVFAGSSLSQSPSEDLKSKVDAVVSEAYQSASTAFPCRLNAEGKPKMLSWKAIEKCYAKAYEQVDWNGLSAKLQAIRDTGKYQTSDLSDVIESSLTTRALLFNKIFLVKETEILLPLSNTILRALPEDSLMNLPVHDKSGKQIGTFAGSYTYEKMGEISGNRLRYSLFQYADLKGKIISSSDRLLLDSFGVPWKEAAPQPGFRLASDKLLPKR